ncbi:unnamed protein product [Triticum turgidum subsp. durum]|uniref:Peptide N-acetyl-beta-D-glucosaminyl asparaginase amidase A N-terminal domain-containing protein n=1 Tax=Triticum turgidum subsp. durum TaxID=4567 RepID=A0A9R1QC38_TRITD|nr:unnamed protein product [Triticum turgidum subsp. durum]
MPTSSAPRLFLLCFFALLSHSHFSAARPHHLRLSAEDVATVEAALPARHLAKAKTTFFEVNRPLHPPRGSSGPCSTLLLSQSFALTLNKPPVTTAYSPPSCLSGGGDVSLAVLEWRADCHGVQYDRRPGGVTWSVHKDVTKYASLLAAGNSTLAVYLGNLIDDTYNGVYYANLTLHLYFRRKAQLTSADSSPADLIVPVSRSLPLDDGLWFVVQNKTDVESTRVAVPANAYRAVLEVYVSSHYSDEFWYMNTPDQNGPFREVTVLLDGDVVGAVWPFPVIYAGGINPLIWRPITSIGSFNLPTYDIELTPFLGKLLDSKEHEVGFAVTNAQNSWYVNGNLHLWLDPKGSPTTGGLISYDAPKLSGSITAHSVDGIDGEYQATASRNISATGWVSSSQRLKRRVEIGFVESYAGAGGAGTSTLRNEQVAEAEVVLRDDQVAGASWRMHQVYNYGASNGGCYLRNVTSVGYDVLFDHNVASCTGTRRR